MFLYRRSFCLSLKPSNLAQLFSRMFPTSLLSFSLLSAALILAVSAHPGEQHDAISSHQLMKARENHNELQSRSNHCANHARAFREERKARRSLRSRGLPVDETMDWLNRVQSEKRDIFASNGTTPHKNFIQNTTCVLNPEVSRHERVQLLVPLALQISDLNFLSNLISKPMVLIMWLESSSVKTIPTVVLGFQW